MKIVEFIIINLCFISIVYSEYSGIFTIPLNGEDYFFSTSERMNWVNALTFCQAFGLDLAKVETVEEHQALYNYTTARNLFNARFYLGGNAIGGINWKWLDGTDVPNSFWQPGEPNLSGNCMILHGKNWYDHSCNAAEYFICEKTSVKSRSPTNTVESSETTMSPSNPTEPLKSSQTI